jgi:O-antigen/teichoic acid export membrane protein
VTAPEVTRSRPTARGLRARALPVAGRLGWGVADQAVSSLSNFALGIYVARSVGATDFGAFSLAFLTFGVVLNASRGLATDPLLVRFSATDDEHWRPAARAATGTALLLGAAAGAVCVVAGLLLPGALGAAFVALGAGLPGLLVQDAVRFSFFAHGRGASAFVNDLVWTVLLVGAVAGLFVSGHATAGGSMLAFGGTATLAALVGLGQARLLPRPAGARAWWRTHRALSTRYLAENVSISTASQLRSFVLGAVVGLAPVGYVRASEMLMGPFLVVLMGLSQVAVPEAARVLSRSSGRLVTFCLGLGGVQAAAALAWGTVLLVVFPLGPGELLLDELWGPTSELVLPITLTVVASSFSVAATAGLRAMAAAPRSLRAQLFASAAYVSGGSLGAVLGGAVGTSWGVTAAQTVSALVWWAQLRAALEEHHRTEGAPL